MSELNPDEKLSVLCFRIAYPWMGKHSGYDAFYHALTGMTDSPLRLSSVNLSRKHPNFFKRRLLNRFYWKVRGSEHYTYKHGETEARLVRTARKQRPDVVYYMSGDQSLGLAGHSPDVFSCPVVATIHQPPTWWKLLHSRHEYLRTLARIVVVSTAQSNFIEEVTGRPPVFIPHGVDTTFYCPNKAIRSARPSFLFVGQWLRDFEALNLIVERTLKRCKEAIFHIVVPDWRRKEPSLLRVGRHENCRFHANLDDRQLLELYQSSTALAMPVIEATANNAVIEATATGLPIVATDCQGIRDYTQPDFSSLIEENDPDLFASRLVDIAERPALAHSMGEAAREFAVSALSWPTVSAKLIDLFVHLPKARKSRRSSSQKQTDQALAGG